MFYLGGDSLAGFSAGGGDSLAGRLGRGRAGSESPPLPRLLDDRLVEPLLGLGEGIPCKIDGNPEPVAV